MMVNNNNNFTAKSIILSTKSPRHQDHSIISEHFVYRLDRTYYPYCIVNDNLIEEREENYKTVVYNKGGQKVTVLEENFVRPISQWDEPGQQGVLTKIWPEARQLPDPDKKHGHKNSMTAEKLIDHNNKRFITFEVHIHPKYPIQTNNLKTVVVVPPLNFIENYKKRRSSSKASIDTTLTEEADDEEILDYQFPVKKLFFDKNNNLVEDKDNGGKWSKFDSDNGKIIYNKDGSMKKSVEMKVMSYFDAMLDQM